MYYKSLFIALLVFVVTGCSKTTVVLLDSGKSENAILVGNEKGETKIDQVGSYVNLKDKETAVSEVKTMSKDEISERFSKVLAAAPLKPLSYTLYFENATTLTKDSELQLIKAFKSIEERSPCMVDIIGHTDTVGSSAINTKVSLKRAKYIESLIKAKGIKVLELVAKGYGEEDLLVKTADNVNEAKNRNVEIFIK